jgi:hypothetical protein
LVRTESGSILPAIKWTGCETYSISTRLQNHVFGEVKGAALKGSIEIDDNKFEADSRHQNEMINRYDSLSRVISRIRR